MIIGEGWPWSLLGSRKTKLSGRDGKEVGAETRYGRAVGADAAMQLSATWACVRLLSETIGALPVGIYTQADNEKAVARDHPLYGLLHDSPSADQTAAEFWEGQVACLALWGNGYSLKKSNSVGLTSLIMLRPDGMTVYRDSNGFRRYRYSVAPYAGDYAERDIFHVRGFGVGGDVGLSPISYARTTLFTARSAEETAGKTFENGLQLSGFVKMKDGTKVTKDQRNELVDLFDRFSGSNRAGKVMPLDPGMDFQQLGMNPEDAQLLQTRAFHVEEICRWFRVPPFMIGHTEKTTSWGTGLEQQTIGFLTYSLRPYLTRIEQAVKKQLIKPEDRGKLFAEFNLEGLLRADSAARASLYSTFAQNGVMTRNEMRAKENLPPAEGGDVLTVQSNLVPIDKLGATAPGSEAAKNALRHWLGIEERNPADAV